MITKDSVFGEQKTEWKAAAKVWAAVAFQRGAQALTAGDVWLTRSVTITMRNNSVINDRCRLVWDGKTYGIESFNRSKTDGSITIVASVLDEK